MWRRGLGRRKDGGGDGDERAVGGLAEEAVKFSQCLGAQGRPGIPVDEAVKPGFVNTPGAILVNAVECLGQPRWRWDFPGRRVRKWNVKGAVNKVGAGTARGAGGVFKEGEKVRGDEGVVLGKVRDHFLKQGGKGRREAGVEGLEGWRWRGNFDIWFQ